MKSITDYNQRDIYTLFKELYKRKHGKDYSGAGFINNEMQLIKGSISEYGAPHIACAAFNCIKNNDRTVNVPYFIAGIKYYITPHNPEIYFAVFTHGDKAIKNLWREYILLDSVWFPNATQQTEYREILNTLKDWVYEKTDGAKNGKSASKNKRKTNRQH